MRKKPDVEKRFKAPGEGNEVLKELETRAAYDPLGIQWMAGQGFRSLPE